MAFGIEDLMFMLEQCQLMMACGVLLREKVIWSYFTRMPGYWKGGNERLLHVSQRCGYDGVRIDHIGGDEGIWAAKEILRGLGLGHRERELRCLVSL